VADDVDAAASDPMGVQEALAGLWTSAMDHLNAASSFRWDPWNDAVTSFCTCVDVGAANCSDDVDCNVEAWNRVVVPAYGGADSSARERDAQRGSLSEEWPYWILHVLWRHVHMIHGRLLLLLLLLWRMSEIWTWQR
jgi:hypothetical protein